MLKAGTRDVLALGCDVGGTEIKAVALRGRRILARGRFPTPAGPAAALMKSIEHAIYDTAAQFLAERYPPLSAFRRPFPRLTPPAPVTLGLALPGFLDRRRARPLHIANLPALEGYPLRSALSRRTGFPVVLDADSNAGAFGEARLGAGRGARRLLYVTLGTGVGAALVADGEVVRVSNHTVGQVAHLPLEPGGPRCSCGARGCVESVLGASGIVWRAARAARAGADLGPVSRITPAGLWGLARAGSRDARRVLREVGSLLGAALALLSNLLSPDRIVVGGGIAGGGDLLLGPAARVLQGRVHPRLRGRLTLAAARLGPFSGAAGAALLGRAAATGQ